MDPQAIQIMLCCAGKPSRIRYSDDQRSLERMLFREGYIESSYDGEHGTTNITDKGRQFLEGLS